MEANDPIAICDIGGYYRDGLNGYPQDHTKALELWHRAGELGHTGAYCSIGYAYKFGRGVEVDKEKAKYCWELAAMGGDTTARHNLGVDEKRSGNFDRALKHYMIAVRSGNSDSLEKIKQMYSDGYATKDQYATALQLYQEYLGEIKSIQRDKAAADNEEYRYH